MTGASHDAGEGPSQGCKLTELAPTIIGDPQDSFHEEALCATNQKLEVGGTLSNEEPSTVIACTSAECNCLDLLNIFQEEVHEVFQSNGGILHKDDAEKWPPHLHTLAYLKSEEVAITILGMVEQLASNELSAAYVAEQRILEWLREWLELSLIERRALVRRMVAGSACLPATTQARFVAIMTELRLGTWEWQGEEMLQKRVDRGRRAGRATLVSMSSLESQELDQLGDTFADALSENLTPLGAARAVVHMDERSREQLAAVLVHENMLSEEGAQKLFRAVSGIVAALGPDQVETLLSGLDAAAGVGGSAVRGGRMVFGSLGSLSGDTLDTLSTAGYDVFRVAASASTHAVTNLSLYASDLATRLSTKDNSIEDGHGSNDLQERTLADGMKISTKVAAPCSAHDFL